MEVLVETEAADISPEELIDTAEAARILNMSEVTLRTWRSRKIGGPLFYRLSGGRVRYRRSDLEAFIQSCRVKPVI